MTAQTSIRAACGAVFLATLLAPAAHAALVPALGSPIAVGAKPWEANATDVTGDGDQDLLVTNENDDTVSVLLGDGARRFTAEAGSPIAVGDNPIATAVADLNGDGRRDVAVTNYLSDRLTILYRKADNSGFVAQDAGPVAAPGSLRYGIAAADVVGDSRVDLVVSNLGASTVSVLEQQTNGSFSEADGSPFAAGAGTAGVAVADFDGDGDRDIAALSNGEDFVTILLNGPAGFEAEAGSPIAVGDAPTRLAASDLNGDTRPDLAIANSGDDNVTILLRNPANDGFVAAAGSPAPAGDKPYDVAAADLDGDGVRELVVSNETDGTLSVLAGTPAAGYAPGPDSPLTVGASPLGLVARDFDGNGRTDVAVADAGSDTVSVRLSDPPTPPPPAAGPGCTPPTAGRVALWRAEGSAGDSVGTHDGLMRGGASFALGVVGTAFALPGGRDQVRFPAAPDLDITGDVTLDAWVRIDDANFGMVDPYGVGGDRLIVHKIDATDRYSTYTLFIEGDGTTAQAAPLGYLAGDRQVGGNNVASFPVAWTPGTWYHVAAVRAGDSVSFYRDGAPIGSGTLGQPAASTPLAGVTLGGTQIDADPNLFNPLKGGVDEAAVWNRALSAAEIASLWAAALGDCAVPPPPPGPPPAPVPPPPPPPPEAPRNLTRPSIVPALDCPTEIGGGGCTTAPNTYRCDPGTWAGRDPSRPYAFTWERMTKDPAYFDGYRPTQVATGEIFRATSATTLGLDAARWLFRCTVTATNDAGSTTAASDRRQLSPAYEPGAGPQNPAVNVRVTGIEVTQGIQARGCEGCVGDLPSRDQAALSQPATVQYQGVRLAAGKYTVVRVFADHVPAGGGTAALSGVTARLEVYSSDGRLLDTLTPQFSPASIPAAPPDRVAWVTFAQRTDIRSSFNFLIPWQQTERQGLRLRAIVNPAKSGLAPLKQCTGCNGNDFTLQGVAFARTEQVRVRPIRISSKGESSSFTEQQMFSTAQHLMPGFVQYFPYPAAVLTVPADKIKATAAVAQWAYDSGFAASDKPVGIFKRDFKNGLGGVTVDRNVVVDRDGLGFAVRVASIAGDDRPISSVAHEIGHQLDLPHADTDPDCGGNSNGQVGVAEPPTNTRGYLLGIGLDARASWALPRVLPDADYDLMSYCLKGEDDSWIGRSNWNRLLAHNAPGGALPRAVPRVAAAPTSPRAATALPRTVPRVAAALTSPPAASALPRAVRGTRAASPARPLRVFATVAAGGGAEIFSIAPGQDARAAGDPSSPLRFELRDAGGRVVASAAPAVQTVVPEGEAPAQLLSATLEFAAAATELVLRRGDEVLARRARSAHPPTASILAPRAGSIGVGRKVEVRWRAADADGGPLKTTTDYSRDGGRTWAVVATDIAGSSASIDRRALGASEDGRIRIRVSDGFDAAIAVSGRLRSRGAPPLVRIEPAPRSARADERVLLRGSAFDDADRPLTGKRLRWFAGRTLLGTGERLSVAGLPAGASRLRLVATDARGRSSTAVAPLRVAAVAPKFLLFDAPETVARTARSVRIRVASSLPATMRIGRRRFAVGRKPRSVTVAVARGRNALALRVTLTASGKVTLGTYRARRS